MTQQNLPMGRIGGHRGLDVIRQAPSPELTLIEKRALHEIGNQGQPPPNGLFGVDLYGMNVTAVHNEAAMLSACCCHKSSVRFIRLDASRQAVCCSVSELKALPASPMNTSTVASDGK